MAFPKLQKELDDIFSEFIRLRDSNDIGWCNCITCGKRGHWKWMDNGHYIRRGHHALRWNEKNCHAQCRECNRDKDGNMDVYTDVMFEKYDHATVGEIHMLKSSIMKYMQYELMEMINHYKLLVKNLKKEKSCES